MAGSAQAVDISAFSDLIGKVSDAVPGMSWEKPLQLCAIQLAADTKKNFSESHTPDGDPWAPLKKPRSRRRDKVKRNPLSTGDKPLVDTGLLMGSVDAGPATKEGAIREIGRSQLVFGSNVFYGFFHQHGVKKNNLPAREWLGISEHSAEIMAKILEEHATNVLLSFFGGFPGGG